MFLWPFNKYPGTDLESFNYEWVIGHLKELKDSVQSAANSAANALTSENNAEASAEEAAQYAEEAAQYADQAKWPVFTPEMYGAIGNGSADDTTAIQDMFDDAKSKAPLFEIGTNHYVSDMTGATFIFPGTYNITNSINIDGVRGLLIEGMELTTNSFAGTAMINFGYDIRSSAIKNCTINANHAANTCIAFTDYTLAVSVDQCSIIKFNQYGISATGSGHELIISDCKIYQYEYAEWTSPDPKSPVGIGIYFDGYRADNHIMGNIINYCVEYGMYIATGPNIISGGHVYSCNCYFGNNNVNVTNMYFDNSQAEVMGGASIRNSTFLITGDRPCIILAELTANKWKYEGSWITGNYCNNLDGVDSYTTVFVDVPDGYNINDTQIALYDNSTVLYRTQAWAPTSVKRRTAADYLPKFDSVAQTITLGNMLIQWGYVESDSAVTFPQEYHYDIPVVMVNRFTSDASGIPYVNSVTLTGCWLGGTNSKKVQWVAIGRHGY